MNIMKTHDASQRNLFPPTLIAIVAALVCASPAMGQHGHNHKDKHDTPSSSLQSGVPDGIVDFMPSGYRRELKHSVMRDSIPALCRNGIISVNQHHGKHACCAATCGSCGENERGCWRRSGGKEQCCTRDIILGERECEGDDDTDCLLSLTRDALVPAGAASAKRQRTEESRKQTQAPHAEQPWPGACPPRSASSGEEGRPRDVYYTGFQHFPLSRLTLRAPGAASGSLEFGEWPPSFRFHFFNDSMLEHSMQLLGGILREEHGIAGVYEAFRGLVPMAYKVDLWRYSILFVCGGIYLDVGSSRKKLESNSPIFDVRLPCFPRSAMRTARPSWHDGTLHYS
jgi:hypothetical protein